MRKTKAERERNRLQLALIIEYCRKHRIRLRRHLCIR